MTLKVSTENILVRFDQDPKHWVISAGIFLSAQGVTVWSVILPTSHQYSYSFYSPVEVVHWTSVKQACTCYQQDHEKLLNTITLKDMHLNMLTLNMLWLLVFHFVFILTHNIIY